MILKYYGYNEEIREKQLLHIIHGRKTALDITDYFHGYSPSAGLFRTPSGVIVRFFGKVWA